jgi:hypothetical protein
MSHGSPGESSKRILEPIERISEVLFGLIMVLTFTGSLSAAESGRLEVRTMLIGALGCNLAWGLIDAIMYLMGSLSERAASLRVVVAVRGAATDEEAGSVIARALPPVVASVLTRDALQRIRAEINRMPGPFGRLQFMIRDWLSAASVFALVFASTIPVVLPFVLLDDARDRSGFARSAVSTFSFGISICSISALLSASS